MAKLIPAVKEMWVKALRSGEYKQATRYLSAPIGYNCGDGAPVVGFCCLGVLATVVGDKFPDILEDAKMDVTRNPFGNIEIVNYSNDGAPEYTMALPDKIWEMLEPAEDQTHYYELNDLQNYTFNEIADEIDKVE